MTERTSRRRIIPRMPMRNTYEGRLVHERQSAAIDFRSPLAPDEDIDVIDSAHYLEVRPGTDVEGYALAVLECTCGWAEAITDVEGGDDFIDPLEIVDLARRHYLALVAGHKISASEVDR